MKLRVTGLAIIMAVFAMAWSCNQLVKATAHVVILKWGASTVSGACVVGTYNIYRSDTSGGEGPIGGTVGLSTHIASTADGSTLTYTDASVVNGKTYWYKITGFGNACNPTESGFSNEVGPMVIPPDPRVLGAPPNATGLVQ